MGDAERTRNRMLFGSLWFIRHAGLFSSHAESEVSKQWTYIHKAVKRDGCITIAAFKKQYTS